VTQEAPWGPIVARATTSAERAAGQGTGPDAPDEDLDESLESFA
jgi:hypothetical protein